MSWLFWTLGGIGAGVVLNKAYDYLVARNAVRRIDAEYKELCGDEA